MGKKKKIILKETRDGQSYPFDFDHALNLLRLQAKKGLKGWVINEKNWQFIDNEITRKPNNRDIEEPEK